VTRDGYEPLTEFPTDLEDIVINWPTGYLANR
jgi:hypothetical protein